LAGTHYIYIIFICWIYKSNPRFLSQPVMPRSIFCYICGRPYLAPSINIHIAQCRDLFNKRESLKPAKERRQCPQDPLTASPAHRTSAGNYTAVTSNRKLDSTQFSYGDGSNKFNKSSYKGLDSISDAFSPSAAVAGLYGLNECPDCHRTFNDTAFERFTSFISIRYISLYNVLYITYV